MYIKSHILKVLIVLSTIISLCMSEKHCSFWEKYIQWHDCSHARNQTTHCTYFQRFVSWDNECSPGADPPHYSKCTELETVLMKKKYCEYNPDEFLDVPQIIARHGYKSETHEVITQDGYILELHRIPNLKEQAQPVFLQHGLFGSSADWLLNGNDSIGNSSLNCFIAFLLVDHGYDVWMGNSRGNTYSDGHSSYPNHNPLYWNFRFSFCG